MNKYLKATAVVCSLAMGCATAAEKVNLLAGKVSYAQKCASCHGGAAEGNLQIQAPPLASQDSAYLIRQIVNFKTGRRVATQADAPAAIMAVVAKTLNNENEIRNIASYLSGQQFKYIKSIGRTAETLAAGRALFPVCIGCHSAHGEGTPGMGAPRIAGMPESYLATQLRAFKSGARGAHPDDKFGRQMVNIVDSLESEDPFQSVSAYLASLAK